MHSSLNEMEEKLEESLGKWILKLKPFVTIKWM